MTSHPASVYRRPESDSGAFFKVAAILLGFAVAVVGFAALMLWSDARAARDESAAGQAPSQPAAMDHNVALPLGSFAGVVPANAQALAEAHRAYNASLPAASAGNLVKVHMTLKDMTVQIAPGVK